MLSGRQTSGAKAPSFFGVFGTAEEDAEKLPKYGHSEEAKTTKNLHLADSEYKQVLRCAQNDRVKEFFSSL